MEFLIILYLVVIICMAVFITIYVTEIRDQFKFTPIIKGPDNLLRFYHHKRILPPADTIDITNPYPCDYDTLRECTVGDPLTCIGCQNLLASCVEFPEDLPYINYNNEEVIIPKLPAGRGYCLLMTTVQERCSRHGQLSLVQVSAESNESLLLCVCTQPGAIGNDRIDGDCTTVRICNGNVNDVNLPLDQMECVCADTHVNDWQNGIPLCVEKVILNATAEELDALLPANYPTIPTSYLTNTLTQNYNGTKVVDPCSICPITGRQINAYTLHFNNSINFCVADSAQPVIVVHDAEVNAFNTDYGSVAIYCDWEYVLDYKSQRFDGSDDFIYICRRDKNPHLSEYFPGSNDYFWISPNFNGLLNMHVLFNIINRVSSYGFPYIYSIRQYSGLTAYAYHFLEQGHFSEEVATTGRGTRVNLNITNQHSLLAYSTRLFTLFINNCAMILNRRCTTWNLNTNTSQNPNFSPRQWENFTVQYDGDNYTMFTNFYPFNIIGYIIRRYDGSEPTRVGTNPLGRCGIGLLRVPQNVYDYMRERLFF